MESPFLDAFIGFMNGHIEKHQRGGEAVSKTGYRSQKCTRFLPF